MKNNISQDELILKLRDKIDNIDSNIINLIANRMTIIKQIGEIKNKNKNNIIDPHRESNLKNLHNKLSNKCNLDPIFVEKLFDLIIKYARSIQKDL